MGFDMFSGKLDNRLAGAIIIHGNIQMLNWVLTCPSWDKAMQNGYIDAKMIKCVNIYPPMLEPTKIEWLLKYGFLNIKTHGQMLCIAAAKKGSLDIIKLMLKRGHKFNREIINAALKNEQTHLIRWAWDAGYR